MPQEEMSATRLCPACQTVFETNYCPNCGQKYTGKRVKFLTLLEDIIDAFFSVDRSVFTNFKALIAKPQKVANAYLEGYRHYYFSPARCLLLAAAVLGINFVIADNTFLAIIFDLENLVVQLAFILFFIPIFSVASWLTYIRFRKNFFEHLVINSYSFSLWIMIFCIPSILLAKDDNMDLKNVLTTLCVALILIWDARVFPLKWGWRILYILLNLLVFSLFFGLGVFLLSLLINKQG